MKKNGWRRMAARACALCLGAGASWGALSSAMATEAGPAAQTSQDSCLEVTVNAQRTPSYDCLTQKLQPKAQPHAADGAQPGLASEAIVQRPSNQLGLFNRAATSSRMGNTFGTSVYPQRPPPVQPALQVPLPSGR